VLAAGFSAAFLLSAVAVATGAVGQLDSAPVEEAPAQDPSWVSTAERVEAGEALPCTGPKDPINFEIFSAGDEVAGLPLTAMVRRCDSGAPADEAPANYVTYVYGSCEIAPSATGCAPPLQVQTWPACQRSISDYSIEGEPLPREELPALSKDGAAEVREVELMETGRIEVYTESSTVVIFSEDPAVAKQAVEELRPQEEGEPPATDAAALAQDEDPARLPAPTAGSMRGALSCQS